jgi:uncharacterized damage-inducible protein DinB
MAMTTKEIRDLFGYDEWARMRTIESVSQLTEELFKKDLKSSHGGIHGTLVHMYFADWIWLERWKGNTPTSTITTDQLPSLTVLTEKWNIYSQALRKFIEEENDDRLAAPLKYRDMKGNEYTQPLYQQMIHRVNHASYHRGQIVTMLRQIGAKPQNTDLIAYYRTLHH